MSTLPKVNFSLQNLKYHLGLNLCFCPEVSYYIFNIKAETEEVLEPIWCLIGADSIKYTTGISVAVLLHQRYASMGCKGANSHQLLAWLILLLLWNKLLTLSCINAIDSIQKSYKKEYLTSTVITLDSEISVLAPSKSQV